MNASDTPAAPPRRGRLAALADRNLRLFFAGQLASILGSTMSALAVTFAVLEVGGDEADVGYVMAARIVPLVALMLVGGAVADRFGPRRIMVTAEFVQFAVQVGFGTALILGRPPIWLFVVLVALWGVGEAFVIPARGALIPQVAAWGAQYEGKLRDANALSGLAQASANVAGPALGGFAVALVGSGVVVLLDAATCLVSATALALLRLPAGMAGGTAAREKGAIRAGLRIFASHTWLWVTTLHVTLFNLLVWAPFLVLGPVVAQYSLGGARDWGLIMGCYGAGSVLGGLLLVGGRTSRRPLVLATLASFGYALPPAALAAAAPVAVISAAALAAGVGSAVSQALYATTNQQHIPPEALGRVLAVASVGAFAFGPVGLAAAGPVAAAAGIPVVLGAATALQVAMCLAVLAVPAVRRLTPPRPRPAEEVAEGTR